MILTYHGAHALKIQQGQTTIAVNPTSANSKVKTSRFGADIVLESSSHADTAGGPDMNAGAKEPFIINSPGEYERDGLFIRAFGSETTYGGSSLRNVVFYFTFEEISFLILGLHEEGVLASTITEEIDEVDVLITPIAGEGVLDPVAAHKLAVKFEPGIIVPTGYADLKDQNLRTFLDEGDMALAAEDKLTFKQKDLETLPSIVVLKQQ